MASEHDLGALPVEFHERLYQLLRVMSGATVAGVRPGRRLGSWVVELAFPGPGGAGRYHLCPGPSRGVTQDAWHSTASRTRRVRATVAPWKVDDMALSCDVLRIGGRVVLAAGGREHTRRLRGRRRILADHRGRAAELHQLRGAARCCCPIARWIARLLTKQATRLGQGAPITTWRTTSSGPAPGGWPWSYTASGMRATKCRRMDDRLESVRPTVQRLSSV